MKKTLILFSILTSLVASAQSIELSPNGGTTNPSAILDLKSTTKGFLLPRMSNAQMRAIPNPAQGLLAFCTDCSTNGDYYFYKGTEWVALGSTTVSVSATVGPVGANASENGATITNGVLNLAPADANNPGIVTKTDQTFGGVKTFSNGIVGDVIGNVTGNAVTVTTNANLTGVVTSTGNATSIANGAITNAMLANGAVANLLGTNTGDQTNITGNAATVTTNANLTGDVTSIGNAATVVKINGTSLSGLATGILKNTTSTGVPTIAAAGTDYQAPITLTTTGSGTATLSSNTLNIPNVSYTLPTATLSVLGGVKPDGTTILNNDGVISVASVAGSGVPYTGATKAVNLGAFDMTVNGLTVGKGTAGISSNTAVGVSALSSNTTGEANTANGNSALSSNTTGFGNTANGKDALFSNTTGIANTANGVEALYHNTTGTENTANGASALFSNTTGFHNTANGSNALLSNTEGSSNTANGVFALIANINGSYNTAIGSSALLENISGSNNTATGSGALFSNTTGEANTANGMNALSLNLLGSNNTAFGQEALYANTNGSSNTAFGNFALKTNTTGTYNTAIGTSAGVLTSNLSNTTAIGYGATVNANNKIQLGNGDVTDVQLGTGAKVTLETGFVKITGGTPGDGKVLTSDADGLASWATPNSIGVDLTTAQTIAGVKTFSVSPVLSSTTASKALFTDANKNIVSNEITGTGNVVMSNAPAFTGTVSGIDKTMVGLANVDNTTDANKPVSTAAQTALNLKADKANPTFTGTVNGIDKTMVGLSSIDNTSDANKPVSTATQTALNLKADKANPTFTGTVSGIDKTMVGLENVNNTSDLNKPISTATQTELDLKANKANPNFTGTLTAANQNLSGTFGLGTNSPDASAKLDITSTTQGFLPPRMTGAQRNLINNPIQGLMIYCTDCGADGEPEYYNGRFWVNMSGVRATGSLKIGDEYQGGKVAYILTNEDIGYDANTQHGIIAATTNSTITWQGIRWNNENISFTNATEDGIGAGLNNTNTIIQSQGETVTSYAAGLARSYSDGIYNDWHLPSKYELNKLYLNRVVIGGFGNYSYWSSTEINSSYVWYQSFIDGSQGSTIYKGNEMQVRAIRYF
jgi:hypothetical protein